MLLRVDDLGHRIEPGDALDHDGVRGHLQAQGVQMLFVLPLHRIKQHEQELHAEKIAVDPGGCHGAKLLYLSASARVAHDSIWGPEWLPVPHQIPDGALSRIHQFPPAPSLERNPGLLIVKREAQVRLSVEVGALRLRKAWRGVAHVALGVRL